MIAVIICGIGGLSRLGKFSRLAGRLTVRNETFSYSGLKDKSIVIWCDNSIIYTTSGRIHEYQQVTHLIGENGNKVMLRLMGLIVMVIAVEFFFSGLTPIIQGILKNTVRLA